MGTYDELDINGITWQTKALGKRMRTVEPGDAVEVERVAATEEEYAQAQTFAYDELPRRYAVAIQATGYALIDDGKLVGIASSEDYAQLLHENNTFDYYGRDEHDAVTHETQIFEPHRPRRTFRVGQPAIKPRPSSNKQDWERELDENS